MLDNITGIFFHIGIHKTGTTFLQREVFPCLTEVEFARSLINIEKLMQARGKPLLISYESLSGRPWGSTSGGNMMPEEKAHSTYSDSRLERVNRRTWLEDFKFHVENIARVFPGARILICFRRHDDLIVSMYKQYLKEGGTGGFSALYDFQKDTGLIKKIDLRYMDRVHYIEKKVGLKPYVFIFDNLKLSWKVEIKKICSYLGVNERGIEEIRNRRANVGVSQYQSKVLRLMNMVDYRYSLDRWILRKARVYPPWRFCTRVLSFLPDADIEIGKELKNKIRDHYSDDWREVKTYAAECEEQLKLSERSDSAS